jgi:hypothetical protein
MAPFKLNGLNEDMSLVLLPLANGVSNTLTLFETISHL